MLAGWNFVHAHRARRANLLLAALTGALRMLESNVALHKLEENVGPHCLAHAALGLSLTRTFFRNPKGTGPVLAQLIAFADPRDLAVFIVDFSNSNATQRDTAVVLQRSQRLTGATEESAVTQKGEATWVFHSPPAPTHVATRRIHLFVYTASPMSCLPSLRRESPPNPHNEKDAGRPCRNETGFCQQLFPTCSFPQPKA